MVETGLMVYALNRPAAPGIAGRAAVIVLTNAARQVAGDSGIQRSVATEEDIQNPVPALSGSL